MRQQDTQRDVRELAKEYPGNVSIQRTPPHLEPPLLLITRLGWYITNNYIEIKSVTSNSVTKIISNNVRPVVESKQTYSNILQFSNRPS